MGFLFLNTYLEFGMLLLRHPLFPYMSQNWILSELWFVHVLKYWGSYWILICVFYLKGCPWKCFMLLVCAVIKVINNLKTKWPTIKQNLWSSILHSFVLFKWWKWVRCLIFSTLTARGILCLKLACLFYSLIIDLLFMSIIFFPNHFLSLTSCSARNNIFNVI